MNRIFISALTGSLVVLASCSQEEISGPTKQSDERLISFRAAVKSRVNPALDYSVNPPATFYVTAFKDGHQAITRPDGTDSIPKAYFEDEQFHQVGSNNYCSPNNMKWPLNSEAKFMEFFAYAPSLEEIEEAAYTQLDPTAPNYETLKSNYANAISFFNMCYSDNNGSYDPVTGSNTFKGVTLYRGFKLGRFYVATDISKQVDFITAHLKSDIPEDPASDQGVKLEFKHQLANIELRAFSGHPRYNIEIAGVRLGRAYTGNAIFNFCNAAGDYDNVEGGQWGISLNPQRLPVEYIFDAGDEVYRMGTFGDAAGNTTSTHNRKDLATSIMGKGGNAMVLPTKNGAWAGKLNPWIASKYINDPEKTPNEWSADDPTKGDMYFSILIRVTLKSSSTDPNRQTEVIYPYRNVTTMNVVYLNKDKNSNRINGRAKAGDVADANSEIVDFGWATVPVAVNWKRGYKYIYTLDFSEGVGIRDPEDPDPGTPIIGSGITFTVTTTPWGEGGSEDQTIPAE